MLSGAKHLWILFAVGQPTQPEIESLPRGFHPLRCFFASLRTTATEDFARSNLLTLVE
jgi:hypothetical protein